MPQYIDGFVLTVPKRNLPAYKKLATIAAKVWKDHGALEYRESVQDDMEPYGMLPFPKLTKAKPDEVILFSYAIFKSRKHRDACNKRIMADPRLASAGVDCSKLFNHKKMAYGGFATLITR